VNFEETNLMSMFNNDKYGSCIHNCTLDEPTQHIFLMKLGCGHVTGINQ
jgi:hypothetical protein